MNANYSAGDDVLLQINKEILTNCLSWLVYAIKFEKFLYRRLESAESA